MIVTYDHQNIFIVQATGHCIFSIIEMGLTTAEGQKLKEFLINSNYHFKK